MRLFTAHRQCSLKRARALHFFFSFTLLHFPASGQAVVTGVVPSPPRFSPSIFIAHRVQQSHCSSIFHRLLLTHALALSTSQVVRKKKSPWIYTSMHSGGFELTKLTYTRVEDNLPLQHGHEKSQLLTQWETENNTTAGFLYGRGRSALTAAWRLSTSLFSSRSQPGKRLCVFASASVLNCTAVVGCVGRRVGRKTTKTTKLCQDHRGAAGSAMSTTKDTCVRQ